MVDPVSGSGAEIARQVAEQASAGDEGQTGVTGVDGGGETTDFEGAMEAAGDDAEVQDVERVEGIEESEMTGETDALGTDELQETGLREFMDGLGSDRERLDAMMEKCKTGGEMDQRELLELQGLIYGYSQRVEIATKVADKAAGGLKQMMNVKV